MTSDYTLYYLSQYKQRDMLQERENDRLAQEAAKAAQERQIQNTSQRQSFQELIASYLLPKNAASKP